MLSAARLLARRRQPRAACTGGGAAPCVAATTPRQPRALRSPAVASSSSSSSKSSRSSRAAAAAAADKRSTSFVRGCFVGELRPRDVFPYPDVLDAEQRENLELLVPMTERFFTDVNDAAANDEAGVIADELWAQLKEMGACGMQVPTEYDGVGLSNTGYARLGEVLGAYDLGLSVALGAHQSIGFKGITLFGNDAQKRAYLPKCASGEWMAAFALTEPSTGSDANSVRTRAEPSADGSHWTLNGSKIWISNGGIAEVFTVFAQTPMPDGSGDKVTAFIVQRSFGGVTHGEPEKKMGIRASNTAEVYFDNVRVPAENVLGDVGGGFKVAMAILNNGRFGMGAALTGAMKSLMRTAAAHANQRVQFDDKIRNYGAVRHKFAHMALRCYATESMAYLISSTMDRGSDDYQLEAACGKVFASEAAWSVADEALQVLGGMGFMRDAGVERVVRDLRIFRIFEGTNEILRLFIALTGAQATGRSLTGAGGASAVFGMLRARAAAAVGVRDAGEPIDDAHPELADAAARVSAGVRAFGGAVQRAVATHKRDIVHEQPRLLRIADAAIDLYAMAAVVARASRALRDGAPGAAHERLLADTFCRVADARVRANLERVNAHKETDAVDAALDRIAVETLDNDGFVPQHPLRL